jgi:hypothetical protein
VGGGVVRCNYFPSTVRTQENFLVVRIRVSDLDPALSRFLLVSVFAFLINDRHIFLNNHRNFPGALF